MEYGREKLQVGITSIFHLHVFILTNSLFHALGSWGRVKKEGDQEKTREDWGEEGWEGPSAFLALVLPHFFLTITLFFLFVPNNREPGTGYLNYC